MTETHRVGAADLLTLATGRGDAAIIRRLAAGQLSRLMLRLHALTAAARGLSAGEIADFRAGYDLAADVQRRDPAAAAEVLTYPSVGAWSSCCLRRLRGTEPGSHPLGTDFGHLGAIAAAAAVRAGHDFEIQVPMRSGTVMLPTLGLARVGHRGDHGRAVLRGYGGRLEIVAGRNAVAAPAAPSADGPGWRGIRRLHATAGKWTVTVTLDDLDPFRAGRDLSASRRVTDAAVQRWQHVFEGAWALLASAHPWYADGIAAGLTTLVPLASPSPADSTSATSRDAFGACALSAPSDPLMLAVTLVHEFQHAKLGALHDLAPLNVPGSDVRSYSPWRDDPRPLGGLLQGAYAYLGITDFWRTQRGTTVTSQPGPVGFAHFEFARWREQTWRATGALERSGLLTGVGHQLVVGMREQLDRWRREEVPDEPSRAAGQAITDHCLSWRLRNLRPDQDYVAWLVAAWLSGSAAPVGGGAGVGARPGPAPGPPTVIASDRVMIRNSRLDLLCLRLKDPRQFARVCAAAPGSARDADIAYARGDMRSAARRYGELIAARPDYVDAWAGLGLAGDWPEGSAMTRSPELVFALYQRIREIRRPAPDPAWLIAWLDAAPGGSTA
jgi:HEXXH motif-containing protein